MKKYDQIKAIEMDEMSYNHSGSLNNQRNGDLETGPKSQNAQAIALWKILDDIDTATDMFHPINGEQSMQVWYDYVQKQIMERHKILFADGYDLFEIGG